jgi:transcriptional regulator with PAS, ATPase and Fis domain
MVGRDVVMRKVFKTIDSVSASKGTVLIQGASGTGKELVAQAVHNRSPRTARPYVVINCGALPASLMERELFGHRRGAFTGAFIDCPGKIEIANTGSLFLDDIDCLSLDMQAKLLRVIQQKEFERLGSHRATKVDIRIIAATNRKLSHLVDEGLFREDLFYRLNVLPIELPALCDRGQDIELLLDHFLKLNARRNRQASKRFTPRARAALKRHHWPGNVRELQNVVERLCVLHKGTTIRAADLPELSCRKRPEAFNGLKLKKATRAFERQHILAALKAVNGSRAQAARQLGIHRNTLLLKTKELGIEFS